LNNSRKKTKCICGNGNQTTVTMVMTKSWLAVGIEWW